MPQAQGIRQMATQRLWKEHTLKPHLVKIFTRNRTNTLSRNFNDIVGMHLNPP
jgi:hypothetical protein